MDEVSAELEQMIQLGLYALASEKPNLQHTGPPERLPTLHTLVEHLSNEVQDVFTAFGPPLPFNFYSRGKVDSSWYQPKPPPGVPLDATAVEFARIVNRTFLEVQSTALAGSHGSESTWAAINAYMVKSLIDLVEPGFRLRTE
jgi:hypothetical protein